MSIWTANCPRSSMWPRCPPSAIIFCAVFARSTDKSEVKKRYNTSSWWSCLAWGRPCHIGLRSFRRQPKTHYFSLAFDVCWFLSQFVLTTGLPALVAQSCHPAESQCTVSSWTADPAFKFRLYPSISLIGYYEYSTTLCMHPGSTGSIPYPLYVGTCHILPVMHPG